MEEDRETIIDIKERLVRIETMLEQQFQTNALERQVIEEKIKVANNRIADLEANQTWTWRAIAGAFLSGVIAFFFKFK